MSELVTIKIDKLTSKMVNTKFGQKEKYGVKSGDRWYDLWASDAPNPIREGDTIKAEIQSREYNGNMYYTLKPPKPKPISESDLAGIEAKLAKIEEMLIRIGLMLKVNPKTETTPPMVKPEVKQEPLPMPPAEEEIPF